MFVYIIFNTMITICVRTDIYLQYKYVCVEQNYAYIIPFLKMNKPLTHYDV